MRGRRWSGGRGLFQSDRARRRASASRRTPDPESSLFERDALCGARGCLGDALDAILQTLERGERSVAANLAEHFSHTRADVRVGILQLGDQILFHWRAE